MHGRILNCCFTALAILALAAATAYADKMAVCVSVLPQKYFVQQIGKDMVDVQVMVQPGASPATYEPKPKQMAALAATRVYFSIGVPFEKVWLGKIAASNPGMIVIPTDQDILKLSMATHDHQDGGAHHLEAGNQSGNSPDPHIWTSPPLVMIQARTILTTLQRVDPVHHDAYETHYRSFMNRLMDLDAELRRALSGKQGLQFMVFHPSWGYFAHAYGLEQIPVEMEGKAPKPAQLQAFIQSALDKKIRVIFVQPQFSTKSAELIARAVGAKVVLADPLALDWAANLKQQAAIFKDVLR